MKGGDHCEVLDLTDVTIIKEGEPPSLSDVYVGKKAALMGSLFNWRRASPLSFPSEDPKRNCIYNEDPNAQNSQLRPQIHQRFALG